MSPKNRIVRFGAFELDLHSRELRKHGHRVRLVGLPVEILICLLETPGEVVTREALRKKLWPDYTFVNFEQSLNAAVKRLRRALNDTAENARFVETLPRRGYPRFWRRVVPRENLRGSLGRKSWAGGQGAYSRDTVGYYKFAENCNWASFRKLAAAWNWFCTSGAFFARKPRYTRPFLGVGLIPSRLELVSKPRPAAIPEQVSFSPDSRLLATAESENLAFGS
jgi:DNA-binding winged helix-turn-helix (wHTH) protein